MQNFDSWGLLGCSLIILTNFLYYLKVTGSDGRHLTQLGVPTYKLSKHIKTGFRGNKVGQRPASRVASTFLLPNLTSVAIFGYFLLFSLSDLHIMHFVTFSILGKSLLYSMSICCCDTFQLANMYYISVKNAS